MPTDPTDQFNLFGSPPSPDDHHKERPAGDVHRLFFALMPSRETAEQATLLSKQWATVNDAKGRPVRSDRLHVTLLHLGDFAGRLPDEVVDAACAAARSLRHAAFDVTFDQTMSFRKKNGNHPFVLVAHDGAPRVKAFQADLVAAVIRAGIAFPKTGFTPHLTLRYDGAIWPTEQAGPVQWLATEFVLIESLHGKNQHRALARWPLAV